MEVGGQRHALAALPPGKHPLSIVQEAGWTPGPVWTGGENLITTWVRSPDRPARSEELYRLSYPGPLYGVIHTQRQCHPCLASMKVFEKEFAITQYFDLQPPSSHHHEFRWTCSGAVWGIENTCIYNQTTHTCIYRMFYNDSAIHRVK